MSTSNKTRFDRFREILALDKAAISQLYSFAILSGFLSLSLPLGIQSVIKYVQSGQVVTSWLVLVILVVAGVVVTGVLQILNLRITETIQQRIFVYFTFDFAYRFPRINRLSLKGKIPSELMNRFFDIMIVQKGTAKLLLDFTQSFLQIGFSLLVLSFYHPFYIGFSLLLILMIYFIFKPIMKKGLGTSYEESSHKYKTVFWLQEIARADWSFRLTPKGNHHLEKLDKHTVDYLTSRTNHFSVLRLQNMWMIAVKAVIVSALLGLGGYLVIERQLSLGQFVAAEVLILLILSSVEKLTQLLETYYDVFTSLEKLGQIQDLEMTYEGDISEKPVNEPIFPIEIIDTSFPELKTLFSLEEGCHTFIHATNQLKTETFLRLIIDPTISATKKPRWNYMVPKPDRLFENLDKFGWYSKGVHLFDGTLFDNVSMGRSDVKPEDFNKALTTAGLSYLIDKYPEGRDVYLSKSNKLLTEEERELILISRALVASPVVLILSFFGLSLSQKDQQDLLDRISNAYPETTIICASKVISHPHWNQFELI